MATPGSLFEAFQGTVNLDDIVETYTKLLPPNKDTNIHRIDYSGMKNESSTEFKSIEKEQLPRESILFETLIEPDTGSPTLTLKVKRKSQTSVSINVTQGFSCGENLLIPFPVPKEIKDDFRGKGGFTRQIYLDQRRVTEASEAVEWDVEASLTADKHTRFSVLLQEREYTANFETAITLSGKVKVECMTSAGKTIYTQPKKISEIIHYLKTSPGIASKISVTLVEMLQQMEVFGDCVEISIKGSCRFKYGINTTIRTEEVEEDDY